MPLQTGRRVMTFKTLASSLAPDGGLGTTSIAATDTAGIYIISNFWEHGFSVRANIDETTGTVSIPCQKIADIDGIGAVSVAYCTSTGTPDRTAAITGTVQSDGTIAIDTWWGVYADEGQYANKAFGWYHTTRLYIPNGTMRESRRDGTSPTPQEYAVVASQSGNVLSVLNFANHGQAVELILGDTRRSTIEQQLAAIDIQHGNIYTSSIADAADGAVTLTPTITTAEATDSRTISWTDWTLRSASSYFGYLSTGSITTDFDLSYPTATTSLEGEGTAASPWLVKSVADLNYLARQCEADATAGRHYAIAADIDMSGTRFQPIGSEEHPFRGIIDGRGHKLSHLLVERSSEGFAALFAYAGAESELRNINLQSPRITSKGQYNAALVAWSDGLIHGCQVMSPTIGTDYPYAAGLAAHANRVSDSQVFLGNLAGTGGNVAGLVADLAGSVTNCGVGDCIIYAGVTATTKVAAGLVGIAAPGTSIIDSYFTGAVSGRPDTRHAHTIGGIVGHASDAKILRCFSVATLENYTDLAYTGGIAGFFSGQMENCYSAGRIISSASPYTGGLIGLSEYDAGHSTTVRNCYTCAETLAGSNANVPALCRELIGHYSPDNTSLANIYYDTNICNLGDDSQRGLNTARLTSASGPEGFPADFWTFTEGLYPRLTTTLSTAASAQSATAIQFQGADHLKRISADTQVKTLGNTALRFLVNGQLATQGRGATVDGSTLRLNGSFATDTLIIRYNPTDFYYHIVKFAPKKFDGEGTADNPYLIRTAADMDVLAQATTEMRQPYAGTHFRLANDIDMAGDTIFTGIALVPYSTAAQFQGVFDGDGHAIRNLRMGKVVWTTEPKNLPDWTGGTYEVTKQNGFVGLFGTLGAKGVIRNLVIDSTCYFEGGSYVAAFAISNGGTIENCRNYAQVRSLGSYAAGFATTNSGKIVNCLNAGDIFSNTTHAAGFASTNFGDLYRVANVGNVTARNLATVYRAATPAATYAGGIVGYNNGYAVQDALNAGTIYCPSTVGGIVAYNPSYGSGGAYNRLNRVVNYGMVSADNAKVGAIVGEGTTNGAVQSVYWDNQILPIFPNASAAMPGMTGLTTEALTSGQLPGGFTEATWTAVKGQYPVLASFADDPRVKEAATTVITMAQDDNARDIASPATLSATASWSLSADNGFSIADGRLVPPATVTGAVSNVLTAVNGAYTKHINIARIPAIALRGAGTEADPYQLASVDDWNVLATHVNTNLIDMAGLYVKLMADIDFSGKDFTPVSGNQWNATFLGNNHKLTGIEHTFAAGKMGTFAKLGPSGSIRDLTIEGTFTQTKATYGAAFVGECYGRIVNCVNRAHITGNKSYRAGFAALAYEGAEFTDCSNYGLIDATTTTAGNAAGICAELKGSATFTRCRNYGKTSGGTYCAGIVSKALPSTFIDCANLADQDNDVSYWGGIIAQADGNAAIQREYVLEDCYNSAELKARGNVAGIVANAGFSNNPMRIVRCYNTGNITAQGTVGTASGLFGTVGRFSHISDCYNTGDITVLNAKSYAAGIVAKTGNGNSVDEPTLFENCRNTGRITSTGSLAAGIACQSGSYVILRKCLNEGEVKADTYSVSGILANNLGAELVVEECRNLGDVTGGTNRIGGIVGTTQTYTAHIRRCVNLGNVRTTNTTAGTVESGTAATGHAIGGIAGQTGAKIADCHNAGTVTGAYQVGGIVGQTYARSGGNYAVISIDRCVNTGQVNGPADATGPILGINTDLPEKETYWTTDASISEAYYLDTVCPASTLPKVGVAVTPAQLGLLEPGESWQRGDDFSFPLLSAHADCEVLLLHVAALHFTGTDTQAKVTRSFNAGCPAGIVWTADNTAIRPDGTRMHVTNDAFTGTVRLTATCGTHKRDYLIAIDKTVGVDGIDAETPVQVRYFTPAGLEVPAATLLPGQPYIRLSRYPDGTTRTTRVIADK